MVDAWPSKPFTFQALIKTFGAMWVRCDFCRRYASFRSAGLRDVDYRDRTFSCSRCGSSAYLCLIEPTREQGLEDYRLDPRDAPARHPAAVARLLARGPGPYVADRSGGELPGRKIDLRR